MVGRRSLLSAIAGVGTMGIAGCSDLLSSGDDSHRGGERPSTPSPPTPEVDRTVVRAYAREASNHAATLAQWNERNRLASILLSDVRLAQLDSTPDMTLALQSNLASLPADVSDLHLLRSGAEGPVVAASTSIDAGTPLSSTDRESKVPDPGNLSADATRSSSYALSNGNVVVGYGSPETSSTAHWLLVEVLVFDVAATITAEERADGGFVRVVDGADRMLVDGDGNAYLEPYASDADSRTPIRMARERRGGRPTSGVVERLAGTPDVIDEPYLVGYAPVPRSDWVVLVHAPHSELPGSA